MNPYNETSISSEILVQLSDHDRVTMYYDPWLGRYTSWVQPRLILAQQYGYGTWFFNFSGRPLAAIPTPSFFYPNLKEKWYTPTECLGPLWMRKMFSPTMKLPRFMWTLLGKYCYQVKVIKG